jgi:steroid delta-isomerase-like uncharacterized protein
MAATAPPVDAGNVALVRWAFDVINSHDTTPLLDVWAPDIVERFPNRTCRGRDEVAAYFADAFAAVPDLHMEVVHAVSEGEDVFVRWTLTGTHTGAAWTGIEATGARIELDGVDHFTIRDGSIVANFVIFDQMAVGRAMGILPQEGSQGDRAMKAAFNAKTKIAEAIRQARSGGS